MSTDVSANSSVDQSLLFMPDDQSSNYADEQRMFIENQREMARIIRQLERDVDQYRKRLNNISQRDLDRIYIHACRIKNGDEAYIKLITSLYEVRPIIIQRERILCDSRAFSDIESVQGARSAGSILLESADEQDLKQKMEEYQKLKKEFDDSQANFRAEKDERLRLDKEVQDLKASSTKEKSDLQAEISKLKKQIQDSSRKEQANQALLKNLNDAKSRLEQEKATLQGQLNTANNSLTQMTNKKNEVDSKLRTMQGQLELLQTMLKTSEDALQRQREAKEKVTNEMNELVQASNRRNRENAQIKKKLENELKEKLYFNGPFFKNPNFKDSHSFKQQLLNIFKQQMKKEIEMTFNIYFEFAEQHKSSDYLDLNVGVPYFLLLRFKNGSVAAIATLENQSQNQSLVIVDRVAIEQKKLKELKLEQDGPFIYLKHGEEEFLRIKRYQLGRCYASSEFCQILKQDTKKRQEIELEQYEIHQLALNQ